MADPITREEFADHMDAFEHRLGARNSRSDRRLESIDSRLDAIDGRLDTIDTRLDVVDGRLRGMSEHADPGAGNRHHTPAWPADRIDALAVQIDRCLQLLSALGERLPVREDAGRESDSAQPFLFPPCDAAIERVLEAPEILVVRLPETSPVPSQVTAAASEAAPAETRRDKAIRKINGVKGKTARSRQTAELPGKTARPRSQRNWARARRS